jgi:hypothetical protein
MIKRHEASTGITGRFSINDWDSSIKYGQFKRPFFWAEQYRRTGKVVNQLLFTEGSACFGNEAMGARRLADR